MTVQVLNFEYINSKEALDYLNIFSVPMSESI
jgi:hypothetical protein